MIITKTLSLSASTGRKGPSAQYAKNVGVVIQCNECQQWQVIYSKTVLSREERNELEETTESLTDIHMWKHITGQ